LDGADVAGSAGADGAAGTAGIFWGSVALSAGSAGRTGKYSGPVWPQAANSRVQQATPAARRIEIEACRAISRESFTFRITV
jgi:hypothetical protein